MINNTPKISIIVPICNVEKYLCQCLESIRKQTLRDIEVICMDDGSTDASSEIIDTFVKKDGRFSVVHKENSGYGNTMNKGFELAKGEYIGIVESDDYIVPKMYEDLYALTDDGTVDVVKGNFWDCYDEKDGTVTKVVNRERKEMPDVIEKFYLSEYPQILWGHPSIWSGIYRRDFILSNGIKFKEVEGGGWVDNPFFFETLCLAKSIKWTRRPYYCYRKTNSASSSNEYNLKLPMERMIDNLDAIDKCNHADEETLKFAYARALMYLIGLTQEKSYIRYKDSVRPYMRKMLNNLKQDVIIDDFNIWDQKNYFKYRSPLYNLIPSQGKVLIYNWVPFDNPGSVGGGVTIYCKNLIQTLLRKRPDIQIYFLSSGWAYDVSVNDTFIRQTDNIFGERLRSFEVVNSPIPAPIDMCFMNPEITFSNDKLRTVIDSFMDENGPFLAVHFNNIEGLSLDVFDLKKKYSQTKFIYSIHNYIPFCMTGFYFDRKEKRICDAKKDSVRCDKCIDRNTFKNIEVEIIKRGQYPVQDAYKYDEYGWLDALGLGDINTKRPATTFTEFTVRATEAINENFDYVLAVSKRVKDIAIENGIDNNILSIDYIGTKIAGYQIGKSSNPVRDYFTIVYLGSDLGYVEKGYPFLLNALSRLETDYAKRINLILTTTTNGKDKSIESKLDAFNDIKIVHGYRHSDLPSILRNANLGIIPVLWEDNLPQVAIEMVANGIPILCSDAGGASELCDSEIFRFENGNEAQFIEKLKRIIDSPSLLDTYWKNHTGLTTMDQHIASLSKYYGLPEEVGGSLSLKDYEDLLEENEFLYSHFSGEERYVTSEEMENLKREISILRSERDDARWRLAETWKSKSFKIGRAVTSIPRSLRKMIMRQK